MATHQSRKQKPEEPKRQWGFGDFVTRYVGPALLVAGVPAIADGIGRTNVLLLGIVCVLLSAAWAGYVWWLKRESDMYPHPKRYRFESGPKRWAKKVGQKGDSHQI